MAFSKGTDDAVQQLELKHVGYLADFLLAAYIGQKVDEHLPFNAFERAIVQQCRIAWRLYSSTLVLLSQNFGIGGAILTRSLFEYVIGVRYLIKNKLNDTVL